MARYLYTIKDRKTGEILFVGGEGDSARFLDCDPSYMSSLTCRCTLAGKRTLYGDKEVTREQVNIDVQCQVCGVTIKDARSNRKYCSACAGKVQRKHNNEGITMQCLQEDGTYIYIHEKQRQMQAKCQGCFYFGGENYMNATCNYLFIVGHSRGCPPGVGCIRRKEKGE